MESEVEELKTHLTSLEVNDSASASPPTTAHTSNHDQVKDTEVKQENHALKKQLTQLSAQLDKATKSVYHERE